MIQSLIPDRAVQMLLHSVINQEAKDIQMWYAECVEGYVEYVP